MYHEHTFCLILYLLTISLFSCFGQEVPTSPVLLWSNYNYLNGKHAENQGLVTISEIEQAFQNDQQIPEVILVFIEPSLSTTQFSLFADAHQRESTGGSFTHIKQLIEHSSSSTSFPYVAGSDEIGSAIVTNLISIALTEQSTIVVAKNPENNIGQPNLRDKRTKNFSLSSFLAELTIKMHEWTIMHNGVTDLIVVCFDSPASSSLDSLKQKFADDDNFVSTVISAMKSVKYVSIFTAEAPGSELKKNYIHASPKLVSRSVQDTPDPNTRPGNSQGSDFWPDNVVQALFIMAFFLFILFTGFCCTLGLQSNLKFELEKAKRQ